MRCRSCNVLNMHALGKRVTQISMNARAVAGVNEVNCLGMLGCGMWGQLLIGQQAAPEETFAPEEHHDTDDREEGEHGLQVLQGYDVEAVQVLTYAEGGRRLAMNYRLKTPYRVR